MSEAYKNAGVNLEAGYEAVNRMKKHVKRTERRGVMGAIGGFGGMFDLSSLPYKEPVLVSGTDGVGTKLQLAFMMDQHETIGIDLVAMCVNDIASQGAEPLYFLDYIGVGKANPVTIEQIVKGVADGCVQAGCALIGGETAEMPGIYDENEYDLAGFAVGACEKSELITGDEIVPGDVLIGFASSGVHSNGFSLVRKVITDAHLDYKQVYDSFEQSLGNVLLTPTKIYVNTLLQLKERHLIKGVAHITGGGFYENIPRMLPGGFGAEIDVATFPLPRIFSFIKEKGKLNSNEMYHVFNMGIGMVMAVSKEKVKETLNVLNDLNEEAYEIGVVTEGGQLVLKGVNV
ncbi:phosphoribosylformylglycinamidine cyclo-ligase [Bacillaceae bacterium W0354]